MKGRGVHAREFGSCLNRLKCFVCLSSSDSSQRSIKQNLHNDVFDNDSLREFCSLDPSYFGAYAQGTTEVDSSVEANC